MNIKQTISNDELLIKILKALADENRLAIIRVLNRQEGSTAYSKLVANFKLSKSTMSYHLRILREAGLITIVRHDQHKAVALNREVFDGVMPGFLHTLARLGINS